MYGLEFHKADNMLICGGAEFEVRKYDGNDKYYRISFGPQGMRLEKPAHTEGGWETINDHAEAEDIEAILPKKSDFGLDWTFSQFMLALTFYGEGRKRGYLQGEWKGREFERNRIKYEQAHKESEPRPIPGSWPHPTV